MDVVKVHNKYHNTAPSDAVYIGRGSIWGNPFSTKESKYPVLTVETVEEAIEKYEQYILNDPNLVSRIRELTGKDLVCFCKPKPCHGDVLLRLANKEKQ